MGSRGLVIRQAKVRPGLLLELIAGQGAIVLPPHERTESCQFGASDKQVKVQIAHAPDVG